MRLLLLVSATTALAVATASSPSSQGGRPGSLRNYGEPSSVTENYHRWDDDRRWGHRWDHYFGDDGDDEVDDDGDEDNDEDGGQEKWPRGQRTGGGSPWTNRGRGEEGDSFGHDHDHGHRGQDKHGRDHGHQGEDEYGHDHGHQVEDKHGHGRDYRGEDEHGDDHDLRGEGKHGQDHGHRVGDEDGEGGNGNYKGHGRHDNNEDGDRDNRAETKHGRDHKPSTHDRSPTRGGNDDQYRNGQDSSHENSGPHQGNKDRGDRARDADNNERGGYHQDGDHGHDNGHSKYPQRGHHDESPDDGTYPPPYNKGGDHDATNGPDPTDGPVKTVRVAQQLRADTEGFVTDALEWVNEIISEDVASTLVIDTTFSLTKNEFADLERGPCGSTALTKAFPVLHKFIDSPKDVDLLDEAVQQIAWTPSSACAATDGSSEVEGGFYASFEIKCAERLVLNVSIASSGSTPTIQGQAVEDMSLFINVDFWNGRIRATDAQGSISGILENRHFSENAADVEKNWTSTLQQCGADRELSVVGVVGGGWTTYTPSDNSSDGYQVAAVGFTESFAFTFPKANDAPSALIPNAVPVPTSVGDIIVAPLLVAQSEAGVATSGASAYVQMGVLCRQSSTAPRACAGHAVMSQLTSFYQGGAASTSSTVPVPESVVARTSKTFPLAAAGAVLVVAFAAATVMTSRRRSGYSTLEVTHLT